jgi:hypothetical protein
VLPKARVTADGEVERLEYVLADRDRVIADVHVDLDEEFKLRLAAESRVKFLEGRVLAWQAVATVSFLIMLGGVFDLFWRWIR